ncbi:MAG: RidA family protein [Lacisediminihabitans sp.]
MSVELFSPAGLAQPAPYHHVAVATGSRHVHVAGQVGGSIVGDQPEPGELAEQVAGALRNTAIALGGAGATFADVVRLTFYVTRWSEEKMGELLAGVESVRGELGIPMPLPPASLIGVETLYEPGALVEIEATAITD